MMRPARAWQLLLQLLLLEAWRTAQASVGWDYAVIIDAGSTGSRAHVYRYYTSAASHSPWAAVELPEAVHRTSPGLSSYAHDPRTAANSLQPLLKFAKQQVPTDQWARTPIQLMATAGLRLLSNGTAERVMAEVRKLLAESGFDYQAADGARVLSGAEEGLWAWVAVNYATGALQAATALDVPSPSQLLLGRKGLPPGASSAASAPPLQGVLELGGGSLQVTLLPRDRLPVGQSAALVLPRLGSDRVYSRSFDGWGLQSALARWASSLAAAKATKDPCLPSGYTSPAGLRGGGSWDECRAGVGRLLPINKTCLYQQCGLGGAFLPKLDGVVFLGIENFYYTSRALGLPTGPTSRLSISQLDAAAAKFCGRSWAALRAQHHQQGGSGQESHLLRVCFSSALIVGLLADGLHLDRKAPLLAASNSVATPKAGTSVEVGWALGALIVEVLQLGGRAISSGHDHILLAPPGSGRGAAASDASAAGLAGSFCLLMLLLSGIASWARVGVIGGPSRGRLSLGLGDAAGGGAGPGGAAGAVMALLPPLPHSTAGGSAGGGGGGGKYQRLRPASAGAGAYQNGTGSGAQGSGSSSIEIAAFSLDSSSRRNPGGLMAAGNGSSSAAFQNGMKKR